MIELSGLIQRFVELVRKTTGNVVPPARHGFLEEVVERRARAAKQPDVASYIRLLMAGELQDEWPKLIPLITIKESYFFRAPQQFAALERTVLPQILRARAGQRRLRVWSAACARGEEPASLAMALAHNDVLASWDWQVLATDLDEDALEAAKRGLYGERAVSQVPPELLERHFRRRGKLYELSPELRARIRYRQLNLAQHPFGLPDEQYDLIFLRNVLIYFDRHLQRRVVSHAARHLPASGFLFLGASETLWQIHDGLQPVDLGTCFCYRLRTAEETAAATSPPRPSRPVRPAPHPAPPPPPRPAKRTAAPPVADAEEERPAAPRPPWEIDSDASPPPDTLAEEPPEAPFGVQERLLEAARDLAANRIDEAAGVVEEILAADPSEAGAYSLEGFVADLRGRTEEAVSSYRAALYLDPALYQVRLLLADCLLRLGSTARAEHEYRQVLASLAAGRERELMMLEELPLPSRQRAERRCRQVLGRH